jgi:LPS-assembly lipoprotein
LLNKRWLPLLLSLALSACGFHLRGAVAIPAVLKETRIVGVAEYAPLALELKRVLVNAGAKVLPAKAKAAATIVISQDNYKRRVLSVDAQGRAAEYGLVYTLSFQVNDAAGKPIVSNQTIELNRDFRFDPNAVLAKESEEQQIRADMIRMAVHQMMRRVDAALKQKG